MTLLSKLVTFPQPSSDYQPYLPTANDYVALPTLRPDGAIESLNVLSGQARGLLEFGGKPLIHPRIGVEGHPLALAPRPQSLVGGPLAPVLSGQRQGVTGEALVFAPPMRRGFVVVLSAENTSGEPREITLEVDLHWSEFNRAIFSRRETGGHRFMAWDTWTRSLVLEITTPVGGAALAVAATESLDEQSISAQMGRARLGKVWRLLPGERAALAFYWAVAEERDGARTTTMDLRRHGWQALREECVRWQESHLPAGLLETDLGRTAASNLLFNRFFAVGRSVDADELALVTSRSPLYYVSAAFWARDALLWSFPGLLLVDAPLAREALLVALARHFNARNAAEHAHYVNGLVLYPGFELDQLAAYVLAIQAFVRATGDRSIVGEEPVARALDVWPEILAAHRHPQSGLYDTFLLSTDDPAPMPYVTYSNALICQALGFLAEIESGRGNTGRAGAFAALADQVRQAIARSCVVAGPFGPQWAGAVDLRGDHLLFDEPPGSLALLAHYGFAPPEDEIYRNTLRWIDSPHNPHLGPAGPLQTASCAHAPYSWTLSLANMLLSGRAERALPILRAAPLDAGLACESFSSETGLPRTGRHFATCAGFVGFALHSCLEQIPV